MPSFKPELKSVNQPIINSALSFKAQLDEFSRELIQQSLIQHQHNLSKTAQALGLDRGNFYRLLKRLAII